mmetsp:Transcript_60110/g.127349  ORF Transcript_60110/g.127349 Transcript_60110/m.127349 type:complete len:200 (+) Transcript_60110:592-1191(+)
MPLVCPARLLSQRQHSSGLIGTCSKEKSVGIFIVVRFCLIVVEVEEPSLRANLGRHRQWRESGWCRQRWQRRPRWRRRDGRSGDHRRLGDQGREGDLGDLRGRGGFVRCAFHNRLPCSLLTPARQSTGQKLATSLLTLMHKTPAGLIQITRHLTTSHRDDVIGVAPDHRWHEGCAGVLDVFHLAISIAYVRVLELVAED